MVHVDAFNIPMDWNSASRCINRDKISGNTDECRTWREEDDLKIKTKEEGKTVILSDYVTVNIAIRNNHDETE